MPICTARTAACAHARWHAGGVAVNPGRRGFRGRPALPWSSAPSGRGGYAGAGTPGRRSIRRWPLRRCLGRLAGCPSRPREPAAGSPRSGGEARGTGREAGRAGSEDAPFVHKDRERKAVYS
nr:MAG TPA: hypothetical protein [Caudoviricetes sp.]